VINKLQRFPVLTLERITAPLVILLLALWLLAGIPAFDALALYFAFTIVTMLVVWSVPARPGSWVGRRTVRRTLVTVIALALLLLAVLPSGRNNSDGIPLVILLLGLGFVILGRATQRVASAPDSRVDERQEALRNRAYRIGYCIFAILAGSIILVSYIASLDSRQWLDNAIKGGGPFITFFLLLFFLPAMVLAWLEPNRLSGDRVTRVAGPRERLAIGMVAVALLTPIALSLALPLTPLRTTTLVRAEPSSQLGASCTYFDARTKVGLGFGAVVPLSAVACWDGNKAYEEWGLNSSDCLLSSSEMTTVETITCTRSTDAEGTLRFNYRARVRSAVLPFMSKDVVRTLALSRDGRVVQFP